MKSSEDGLQVLMVQQTHILHELITGAPLTDVLIRLVESIEIRFPGMISTIYLLSEDAQFLSVAAGRNGPVYLHNSKDGLRVGPKTTPYGEAAHRKIPVLIHDIRKSQYWAHLVDAFEAEGLSACWSLPLFDSKQCVRGTFTVYHHSPMYLSDDELNILATYAYVIGIVVEKYELDKQLTHIAYFDDLTLLPNRRYFMKQVDGVIEEGHFAILKICLEEFQFFNDGLGYKLANKILQYIAQTLTNCVFQTASSSMVARTGTREFSVLLLQEDAEHARQVANRLLEVVAEPFEIEHLKLQLSASVGIVVGSSDKCDVETLMQHADIAMHAAKKLGRNQFQVYEATLTEDITYRMELTTELIAAIERDDFCLYYQPRVHTRTGVLSAEALIRWIHPDRGIILPGDFIPLAEYTGQIVPLGWLVLRKACSQIREWIDSGIEPVRISINISASQFGPELIEQLTMAFTHYDIDSKWIEIEITEGVLMKFEKTAFQTLDDLKRMGIVVSLDDFGTGYSSLGFLQKYQIDSIKIDRSFIQRATHDDKAAAIVKSIIGLSHALQVRVIAEGVETEEQVNFLNEHGCQKMQGFYFYKPLPPSEFRSVLINR